MKKSILFVMSPLISHLLPTFKIGKHFLDRDYNVVYVSTNKLKKEIEYNNFVFQDSSVSVNKVFLQVESLIPYLISKYKPVIFLIELSFWNWALFLKGLNCSFMMIQTWPCCDKTKYSKPIGYRSFKYRNPITFLMSEFLWLKENKKNKRYFKNKNFKNYYLNTLDKACLDSNKKHLSKTDRVVHFNVLGTTELILLPSELDFPRKKKANVKFIGPFVDNHRLEKEFDWSSIDSNNKTTVFCSLGTLSSRFKERTFFYERVIKSFSTLENMILIMSVGKNKLLIEKTFSLKNVFLFEYVPQIKVLQKADIFITHGGAGSIKEAMRFGVPLLIYPWGDITDRLGNADRVRYHNLGIIGDLVQDSPKKIRERIVNLKKSISIKKNVMKMKKIFIDYEKNESSIIDFILKDTEQNKY